MKNSRILIISEHALFADAIAHTLKEEGIKVTATAKDMDAAWPLLQEHQPDIIIVDYNKGYTPDANIHAFLNDNSSKDRQVIFLTLDDNQMVVHYRKHVGDVTPADLISVLRGNTLANALLKKAT